MVRERLEASLGDPHFGLAAAQSLGRMGHPAALPILVEEGLKKLGYYSWVQLDAESFRPYGPRAETALLGLMDYPNAMTRGTVRKLLVDLGSEEGARRITREFQASLASGTAPPAYTVSALLDMGQDPVMNLVSLAVEHPELMDSLYWEHTDGERIGRLLLQNLRAETDTRRATAAIALLKKADTEALEAELEALRTSHPLDAVREALGRSRK